MGYKLNRKQGAGESPVLRVRLTELQYKRLNNIAKKKGLRRSSIVRIAIQAWLDHRKRLK